jgi:hypothetical protein
MMGDAELLHAPANVALAHVLPFLRHPTSVRGDVRRSATSVGRRDSDHPSGCTLAHAAILAEIGRRRKPPAVRPPGDLLGTQVHAWVHCVLAGNTSSHGAKDAQRISGSESPVRADSSSRGPIPGTDYDSRWTIATRLCRLLASAPLPCIRKKVAPMLTEFGLGAQLSRYGDTNAGRFERVTGPDATH